VAARCLRSSQSKEYTRVGMWAEGLKLSTVP
jgi:hypothetical protein